MDYSVWKLCGEHNKGHTIVKKDYARTREDNVVMDYSLIKRFLERLERTFQMGRRYDFRHRMKTSDGLKSCQEITISKIAVSNLADFCIGKKTNFEI